jgi:hypothetical protein
MIKTTIADKERWLARRKAELGIEGRNYVKANSGIRRTEQKRALLRAINEGAAARGATPPFGTPLKD